MVTTENTNGGAANTASGPMSDTPEVTVTQREGPPPNDGVPTFGWRWVQLRATKVRCQICGRWKRIGVIDLDADEHDPALKLVCKQCYDDMP